MKDFVRRAVRRLARPFHPLFVRHFVPRAEFERLVAENRSAVLSNRAIYDLACMMIGAKLNDASHEAARSSTSDKTSVGVVIPTCDRPNSLRAALRSIASQTRLPDHVIVVNDGAQKVDAIVAEFSRSMRVVVLETARPRSGASVARNIALEALGTDFVGFLDDDNLMWPTWLQEASAILEADSGIDLVYGAQLRDVSPLQMEWFLSDFSAKKIAQENLIDLNQIVHRAGAARFDAKLRRLNDWAYVRALVEGAAGRVAATNSISSIYANRVKRERITIPAWPPDLVELTARHMGAAGGSAAPAHTCSACRASGAFVPGPNGRPHAGCPRCGSLERHRFLALVGPLLRHIWITADPLSRMVRLLEVAPSAATQSFRGLFDRTVTIDADPAADGRAVDAVASLTGLPCADGTMDALVALHVLEHIEDDRSAMAEIRRVLSGRGVAVLQVPLSSSATTDEEPLSSPNERKARYGQADHVRLYGADFFDRLSAAGLRWIKVSPRECMADFSVTKYRLAADEALVFAVRDDSPVAVEKLQTFESVLHRGREQIAELG